MKSDVYDIILEIEEEMGIKLTPSEVDMFKLGYNSGYRDALIEISDRIMPNHNR